MTLPMNHGCHTIKSRSGETLFLGEYAPKIMFGVLTQGNPDYWRGKRVLDLGCNTAGISLEIARAGAADVVPVDPDPYDNGLTLVLDILKRLSEGEELNLRPVRGSLFDAHQLGSFDIVLLLGVIYHFRDLQFLLDFLSTLDVKEAFISSPTHAGEGLVNFNRRGLANDRDLPGDFFDNLPRHVFGDEIILTGWHPTHDLLERQIRWAGFENVQALSDRSINAPQTPKGWTNSAYYRATKVRTVDPIESRKVYYPR